MTPNVILLSRSVLVRWIHHLVGVSVGIGVHLLTVVYVLNRRADISR